MSWSTASRQRVDKELAKLGIDANILVMDIQDVPEAREACRGRNWDELFRLALEWFGDKQHPQPVKRRIWLRRADESTGCIGVSNQDKKRP